MTSLGFKIYMVLARTIRQQKEVKGFQLQACKELVQVTNSHGHRESMYLNVFFPSKHQTFNTEEKQES